MGSSGPHRTSPDVLVIGAGAVGLCCAYFLSQAGAAVTVVERGPVGGPQSCSAANTGFVGTQGTAPLAEPGALAQGLRWLAGRGGPFAIRPAPCRELPSWLWRFQRLCTESDARACSAILLDLKRRSLGILRELCTAEPLADSYREGGMIIAFKTDAGFARARAAMPRAIAGGVPLRELNRAGLAALEPDAEFDVRGTLFNAEGATVRTPEFITGLAAVARRAGAKIVPDVAVTGFGRAGSLATRVRTSRADISPGEVVIAAGAWSAPLARALGLRLLLLPAKGYTVTITRPPAAPRLPVLLSEARLAILPAGDRLRFGGIVELGARSTSVTASRVARLTATVQSYLPGLDLPQDRRSGPAELWAGLRSCTPDSLPLLGRAAAYRNVSVACGHGSIGMGLAPVSGRLVAQLLSGERPELDLAPLQPDRFARPDRTGRADWVAAR